MPLVFCIWWERALLIVAPSEAFLQEQEGLAAHRRHTKLVLPEEGLRNTRTCTHAVELVKGVVASGVGVGTASPAMEELVRFIVNQGNFPCLRQQG